MRKVIVNSTPLIVLCGIGRLDILREMYQEIYIPYAVFQEVTAKDDSVCVQICSAGDWIHVEQIHDYSEKKMYKAKQQGKIEKISPLLLEMRKNGFYVSNTVERMVLEQVGEYKKIND